MVNIDSAENSLRRRIGILVDKAKKEDSLFDEKILENKDLEEQYQILKKYDNRILFDIRLNNMIPKVMGGDLIPKPYDESKIREALKRETNLEGKIVDMLIESVSRYLIGNKIKIITAPMIREVVNSLCLKYNLEIIRLKHTRVGLPKWDLDNIYEENGNVDYIDKSITLVNNLIFELEEIYKLKNIDFIIEKLKKIKETIEEWYDSSDKKILEHIKKENENINNLIKVLEGEKNENGN